MKIFIIAGEPSGDEYGAKLMEELNKNNSELTFCGIGGTLMEAQGLKSMVPLNDIAVMGFSEIIKKIFYFLKLEKQILSFIKHNAPQKIILIDYPGFNLRIAKKIKAISNAKIIYYISPQIWAWKEKRINIIKKYVDELLVIFEFEKKWYQERGVKTHYIGHPFLDIWTKGHNINEFIEKNKIDIQKPILTLFPGSRKQEVKRHLSLFVDAALHLKSIVPELQILLGLHSDLELKKSIDKDVKIIEHDQLKALEIANAAIISSGTATLQSAIMGVPAVVVYKMNTISWLITKFFVNVKFASMANIIMNKEIYKEHLQNNATKEQIVASISKIFTDNLYKENLISEIKQINESVGSAGATKKAAKLIEMI